MDDARVVKESSDSGVELEQAADSVATAKNGSALRRYVWRREEEKLVFTLVVLFRMVLVAVLDQRAGNEASPNRMSLDRHSGRIEHT